MRTLVAVLVASGMLAPPAGAQGRRENRMAERFAEMDRNRDGVITRSEWKGSRQSFNEADWNRDGVLSGNEVRADGRDEWRRSRPEVRTVDVDARARWIFTGFVVQKGDTLNFDAQGTIQLSADANDTAISAGSLSGRRAANAPLRRELAGALIARIGNGRPFAVGDQIQIIAPETGELFLGVNDDHLADNRGRFRVRIALRY